MRALTATHRRAARPGTEAKASEPRTAVSPLPQISTTTGKARYGLMRQALEAARGREQTSPDSEDRVLKFLRSQ
ncbi:hypothetical protein PX52LOC_02429 [Limnoglobus roseus]|uniref:Uncharacterized protein n=1 Tax=Limnoglobus roseus TaxID=2598579 RepID=A0A5C1ABV0_9BACT|nr:hypothetical protein PX52LOC_02429 [Limnoglobus roseus]